MTRKDYEAVAQAARDARATMREHAGDAGERHAAEAAVTEVVLNIADYLSDDNARFDRERFLQAALGDVEAARRRRVYGPDGEPVMVSIPTK